MSSLESAISIAVDAHEGQQDKAGFPYILHPLRMMFAMESQTDRIVAVLHDVVEDTPWTLEQLRTQGFSEEVIDAVDHVTRRKDETYEGFIGRISGNETAIRVKLADLKDNMDITRIDTIQEKDLKRLKKYHDAWKHLSGFRWKPAKIG